MSSKPILPEMQGENALITGVGILGFRSFESSMQLLGPLSKINLIIGANNSGKSNVLSFIQKNYPQKHNQGVYPIARDQDVPLNNPEPLAIDIAFTKEMMRDKAVADYRLNKFHATRFEKLLESEILHRNTDLIWLPYGQSERFSRLGAALYDAAILNDQEWLALWQLFMPNISGGLIKDYPADILRAISLIVPLENIEIIPAFRKVGELNSEESFAGGGLTLRLARLQNPDLPNREKDKLLFDKINAFVQAVLGNQSAKLEIPQSLSAINVQMDGKVLPLSALGTGVQEVIILAAAASILTNRVVCIEEPELHLHPLLQKQLLRYLVRQTNNQYFISTHSAHLLETPDVAVFHVRMHKNGSIIEPATSDSQKSEICKALGYRASDLMQANCIIWVEGPSDRIYLNYWLASKAAELTEGLHYSIMFYGGRLLAHLSGLDCIFAQTASLAPDLMEKATQDLKQTNRNLECLISLRRLNRYISILIDSDKPDESAQINQTKLNITKEFEQGPGFAWVTSGRTIENYIAVADLGKAINSVHSRSTSPQIVNQYSEAFKRTTRKGRLTDIDKVKVAEWIVTNVPPNFEILDLDSRIADMVRFVRDANS